MTVSPRLEAEDEGYDGIIIIGPFNCLPFPISEAILKPFGIRHGMPVLTYESDGYAVSPSVLRQVDVHIQQVLSRAARDVRQTFMRKVNCAARRIPMVFSFCQVG